MKANGKLAGSALLTHEFLIIFSHKDRFSGSLVIQSSVPGIAACSGMGTAYWCVILPL
jgi:hypothetical protein